jgi:hypothetical protein
MRNSSLSANAMAARQRLEVTLGNGAEQEQLDELIVVQRLAAGREKSLTQSLAMAVVVRNGGGGRQCRFDCDGLGQAATRSMGIRCSHRLEQTGNMGKSQGREMPMMARSDVLRVQQGGGAPPTANQIRRMIGGPQECW